MWAHYRKIQSGGCSADADQKVENKSFKKLYFISIHKPPASITSVFRHALAATV
jgi:hypothetical protein